MKKLNMISFGSNVPMADERKKFSRMMLTEEIEEHPDFSNLYKISPELLSRITESMKKKGFDESQPLHIWLKDGHKYLVDGYTRFKASKASGITSVPVYEHEFASFDEAYSYVLSLQVNRRNLESDELLRNIEVLSRCDFVKKKEGSVSLRIADMLGICQRTAERAISVEKNAGPEMKEMIHRGELTVNQAYKKLHADTLNKKKMTEKERVKDTVSRIAFYVMAEMKDGFPAEDLLHDEDFKAALEDPFGFELPENDIQLMVHMGIDEKLLRGKNDS